MVPTISLSDRAYEALCSQKKVGESDSEVVLRLVRVASGNQKDPMWFFRKPPEAAWPADLEKKVRQKMRQKDIRRMTGASAESGRR